MKAKVSERRLCALPLLGICLLTVCAFLPTFWNGFQMEWDDQWMVMNSLTVGRWNAYLLQSIFTVPSHGQIGSLNQLMYTVLYHVFGFNPLVFHMASLPLHLVNVCLLYVGLSMVLQDCLAIDAGRIRRGNFITVILFAPLLKRCPKGERVHRKEKARWRETVLGAVTKNIQCIEIVSV